MTGWYGLWKTFRSSFERWKSGDKNSASELKFPKIITLVIRLEFVYYILLILLQFLTNSPLSTFWVLFMFLYHLLGFLGNERYRIINTRKVKSDNSPGWKRYLLLVVIAALDLLEFYVNYVL